MSATYDLLAKLPVRVESYELEPLERDVSSEFTRTATVIHLRGGGHEGVGEDVTYSAAEQVALQLAGATQPLAGNHTLDSFSELLGTLDLFPTGAPETEAWRLYRRWAFESAALDLGLRQAGLSLAAALGRELKPVRFVVSRRLGEPPAVEPIRHLLGLYPGTRFKLDPTSDWDAKLVEELVALDCVETVDLKGAYRGTVVDQRAEPGLYRLVAEGFPSAWIEDPDLRDPEIDAILAPHRDRITWDAIIHSVGDIDGLPFAPRTLNFKPSRFGSLRALLDAYDHCAERGIGLYGGGQFELGPGRGQIQYLASLFHPDGPNDVAPGEFNDPRPGSGLPGSPLLLEPDSIGFRAVAGNAARA